MYKSLRWKLEKLMTPAFRRDKLRSHAENSLYCRLWEQRILVTTEPIHSTYRHRNYLGRGMTTR